MIKRKSSYMLINFSLQYFLSFEAARDWNMNGDICGSQSFINKHDDGCSCGDVAFASLNDSIELQI